MKTKKSIMKDAKVGAVEKKLLEIAIELAKKGEGALFIVGSEVEYEVLLKQTIPPFSIFDSGADKLLKSIATIDGAIVLDKAGNVMAYGAMIKKSKPFLGYGTRHAAALTGSKNKRIAILSSEEERKVKIFRDGKFVMQMDALQKNIEKEIPKVASFLEAIGAGLLGTVGATVLVPAVGVALLPGVIIFGASYYALKSIIKHLKR
jgi:DNA integrity scanning protein DisA with diadenylate cyclase activity